MSKLPLAFIDYYNKNNVIPVSQNLSNLSEFIFKRNHLYMTLGFPLSRLRGLKILEVGPGGGYNAIATSFYSPSLYTFVDASTASLSQLQARYDQGLFNAEEVRIHESNFLEYKSDEKYDLVICEGTLPAQQNPVEFLNKLTSFVGEGGGLIITTITASSLLSDVCRRMLRPFIFASSKNFEEQVKLSSDIFASHLNTLGTSTRPIEDWVIDQILQDWHAYRYVFSILDAADSISDSFSFYNSSPSFLIDDRWYKKVGQTDATRTDLLRHQYGVIAVSLLDYRVPIGSVLEIENKQSLTQIESLSSQICLLHNEILNSNSYHSIGKVIHTLKEMSNTLPEAFSKTKNSMADYSRVLTELSYSGNLLEFGEFKKFWGRGQQYVSFLRKIDSNC